MGKYGIQKSFDVLALGTDFRVTSLEQLSLAEFSGE